jgi:hypothetical protein
VTRRYARGKLAEPAPSASVVIPVKDGARWLGEVSPPSLRRKLGLEVLVIDSGSRDHSMDIARAAGVSVLEIEPASFGHGRTPSWARRAPAASWSAS